MTLVGLLPPICDNGEMLVDGGYSMFFQLDDSLGLKVSLFSG